MADCPRIGKLFGGCKFSPRYDVTAPNPEQLEALLYQLSDDIAVLVSRSYAGEACQRCGRITAREAA